MNPDLARLHPYPFERLAALLDGVQPGALAPISLSIGEPKHAAPAFVLEELRRHGAGYSQYPKTQGSTQLREAIADWLTARFRLSTGSLTAAAHVLPVNGSREALFAFTQAAIDRSRHAAPLVAMPNPFYQIYEGAALLAGASPLFLPERADRPGIPDFAAVAEADWARCQMLVVCSPGNPTGAVLDLEDWGTIFALADRHDLVVVSDECYSELYPDEDAPPVGVLEACRHHGRQGFERCMAFHSLSKRSSLPGMRSGFVAGDAALIRSFLLYRTYHGSAMPPPHQAASTLAWRDEQHVRENRALYRAKFAAVLAELDGCLEVSAPAGGFYLWPRTPCDEREFARELYRRCNVLVLPGSFLSRPTPRGDPGARRVRLALVAGLEECVEAARRIRGFVATL
ncbi:MAG: succinyldiaminopimelate transaminase [Gammaproteobacteria bacterium]|nr:succinyldiaminopimelate transaminase [Gammaproteobacteria bacterium]